jgi:monovalent cation:H+ antiporter-2, CPA2 family
MDHHGPAIGSLVLVAVLAFVVPLLVGRLRRIRIPIAAGEILAGMVVGKTGLNLLNSSDPLLQLFTFLGLSSLMFLSGMEIDLAALVGGSQRPTGRPAWLQRLYHPLGIALAIFTASLGGAYLFTAYLQGQGLVSEPLFLTTIIATAGLTIIMPVLKDRDLLNKPFGQVLFNTAVLGDILPLLGLSVLVAYKTKGSALESLWILALVAASFVLYLLGGRFRRWNLMKGLAHGTAQIGVRAAFALMLVFLALADLVGVEAILGAFVAGLLLSALVGHGREEITHKLDALGFGFLIPIFFLMVGVDFDLPALLRDRQALLLVPLLFAGTFVVKALPALLLGVWYPLRQTLAGMVLLTTQMSVTIAASAIAHQVGAYGASIHAAVVLVAILTAIVGPVLFHKVLGEPEAQPERTGVILAGMNRLGLLLGRRLAASGYQVKAVDQHTDRMEEFMQANIPAVLADPAAEAGLKQAGAEQAHTLLAVTEDEVANLQAARTGREQFGIPRLILFARSSETTEQARAEGFEVVNPDLSTVALLENLLHSPAAAALMTGGDEDLHLADFVLEGGRLVGQALRNVSLPPQVLVVSVMRGREKIVPHGNTVFQQGDRLTVVGPAEAMETMRPMVRG